MRPPPPLANPGRWHEVVPPPGDWRKQGLCHNQPHLTALFYPPTEDQPNGWQLPATISGWHAAKALCAQCPVRENCADYAMTTNQDYGVWGGMTTPERRKIRRSWRYQNRKRLDQAARQEEFDGI